MTEGHERQARAVLDALVHRGRLPGVQYVVVDSGGIVFEYAGGCADLRSRTPMTRDTTMMAYSMSKTITAAAVLQLVDDHRVELDHPIDAYLEAQPYGTAVTVRHLLAHTSGIPNPMPLRWVHPLAEHAAFQEPSALAAVLRQHNRLSSQPGTTFAYSNIGYWLLGGIIERASGEPFVSYVQRRVLERLGIESAALGYTVVNPDHHATGYLEKFSLINLIKGFVVDRALIGEYAGPWLEIRGHYLNGPAFGGLVGTAGAFGVFLLDQLQPHSRLFGDGARALFYEQQQVSTGTPVPMTLGWHVCTASGQRCFFKEGGGGGFHSMMRLYPSSGLGTVVIANATRFDVRGLLDELDPLLSRESR